ncbi:MAG: hypothetical protein KKE17_01610 [Proteobacteria bacterium]|nr:hypothetical protein [Pseudomonadota bacterium]
MASADTNVYSMGPAGMDSLTFDDAENFTVQVSVPGIYDITAEVTDASSNVYSDAAAILVVDKVALDTLLKAKWDGMKSALAVQDVEGGLGYFSERTKDTYRSIFNAIGGQLPQLIADMQDIEIIYVDDNIAKYRIRRTHDIEGAPVILSYYIYFIKGDDGIWKIEQY